MKKALKITISCIGTLIILILGALTFLTFWLTPERLAKLVANYADEYVEADIQASAIDFKIWSTFPYFDLRVDSALIVSKRFKALTPEDRKLLPADADTLASFTSFHGSINPLYLIVGKIDIKDVSVSALNLNLVALNDTLTNYNIVPPSEEKTPFSMPRFTVKKIEFIDLRPIKYYSAATEAYALLNLKNASMTRNQKKHNLYRLLLKGLFELKVKNNTLLKGFPFLLDGDLMFDFDPFRVKVEKYNMAFGNLKSKIDLTMDIGDTSSLTNFEYTISPFSLLKLLTYLPSIQIPQLSDIQSDLSLEASLKLTSPYSFSNDTLPSFALNFRVPDSWLNYTIQGDGTYRLNHISLAASLLFNGLDINKSQFQIFNLDIEGEGILLALNAIASNLFQSPAFNVNLKGDMNLQRVAKFLPSLSDIFIKGRLQCDLASHFTLDDIINERYSHIDASGKAYLRGLTYINKAEGIELHNRSSNFTFGSNVVKLGKVKAANGMLAFTADADTLSIATPDVTATAGHLQFHGAMTRDVLSSTSTSGKILPFGITTTLKTARLLSLADSMKIRLHNIDLIGTLTRYEGNAHSPLLNMQLSAGKVAYRDALSFANVKGAEATLNVHLNSRSATKKTSRYKIRYDSIAKANPLLSSDSIAYLAKASQKVSNNKDQANIITLDLDRSLRSLIRRWNLSGKLKAASGMFASYLYPTRSRISSLNMDFSLDSIKLHSLHLNSQSNSMDIRGSIRNLRRFMLGGKPSPIKIDLNIVADTLSLNEMAGTYEAGQRLQQRLLDSGLLPPNTIDDIEQQNTTPIDTTSSFTALLPRNIDANINILAHEASYTNLHISDIGTRIIVKESALNIDSLHARTDFGSAYLNLLYSTRNIDNILMSFDLGFDRIDVVLFFQRFQALLAMMPDMSNLSGFVSAKTAGSLHLFPNMDIDFPSIRAVVDIRGNELKVHQNAFIRHIARMLLIRQKEDLKIENMVVQASIHDNLLELYPFIFQMPKYKLGLMGENDFNGNLYYHISVLKSPIPFKFGINIKGNFDKYKIRFGGAKYHTDQATRIVNLVDERRINLVKEMKSFINKLVHKAALSDVGSPHTNLLKNGPLSQYRQHQDSIHQAAERTIEEQEHLFPLTPVRILLQHKNEIEKATSSTTPKQ